MLRKLGYGARLVRDFNELNILRFIKDFGPLSRAQLSKKYKISKATVSEIVAKLLETGFVKEVGMGKSSKVGGRKPILLEFNPLSGYALGLEIKRDHARIALTDLNARIHRHDTIHYPRGTDLITILKRIFEYIDEYQNIKWVRYGQAMGIGVAIPGLVDYKRGFILESDSHKNWEGVEIASIIEERFNIETVIENDVKAITFGECRFGNGRNSRDMVFLWIGDGIGAGIVINGDLYRGVSASAGEVGYFDVGYAIRDGAEFRRLSRNGHRNFGDILSQSVLISAARKGIKENVKTELCLENLGTDEIFIKAQEGDPLALEIVSEYAGLVGLLCINLINTLNPEVLLIGGEPFAYNPFLLELIRERINKDALHTPIMAVRLQHAALKECAAVLGAVGLVLDDIFYADQLNLERYRTIFSRA